MNWGELMSLYTGSMTKYVNWARLKDIKYNTNKRDLFDFFDEQGIIVEIEMNWGTLMFYPTVNSNNVSEMEYETRQEAEEAAFEYAFQLLEEKLNGGK
jgi:RNA recognition motif-containing protein